MILCFSVLALDSVSDLIHYFGNCCSFELSKLTITGEC